MISGASTIDREYVGKMDRFGMWIFIAMEILFFSGVLFVYFVDRSFYPEAFATGSRHLELGLATINTAVLLTSSFTMALAVQFLKKLKITKVKLYLAGTAFFGTLFLALKFYEYYLDAQHGTLPFVSYFFNEGPKEVYLFFSVYFLLTLIHAVHLIVAVSWCTIVAILIQRSKSLKLHESNLHSLGLYWHFVDIIWVLLLPLLYMVGNK